MKPVVEHETRPKRDSDYWALRGKAERRLWECVSSLWKSLHAQGYEVRSPTCTIPTREML